MAREAGRSPTRQIEFLKQKSETISRHSNLQKDPTRGPPSAVLNQGRLEQYSPPTEVYDAPKSLFVNTFVGTANTLSGKLVAVNGEATVALDIGTEIKTRVPSKA